MMSNPAMHSGWRGSLPDKTGTLLRIASFKRSCRSLFSPAHDRPLFFNSSFSWVSLSIIIASTVSSAVAAGSGGDGGAAGGQLSSSGSIYASPLSLETLEKEVSPPSESYPSSLNSEFWFWNQFFREGTALGKMDPHSAPSKTVPLAVPSTSASKLVIDRPIGKRGPMFAWSATPLSTAAEMT